MCKSIYSHIHFSIHLEKLHQDHTHRHLMWYNRKAQFQQNKSNNPKPAQCCHNFFQFPRAMLLLSLLFVLLSFHWKKLSHFFMLFVVCCLLFLYFYFYFCSFLIYKMVHSFYICIYFGWIFLCAFLSMLLP